MASPFQLCARCKAAPSSNPGNSWSWVQTVKAKNEIRSDRQHCADLFIGESKSEHPKVWSHLVQHQSRSGDPGSFFLLWTSLFCWNVHFFMWQIINWDIILHPTEVLIGSCHRDRPDKLQLHSRARAESREQDSLSGWFDRRAATEDTKASKRSCRGTSNVPVASA